MPSQIPSVRRRTDWSLVAILLMTCAAPAELEATESIPRACESELNFKAIAQMVDQAGDFERRLSLLARSLVQQRSPSPAAGDDQRPASSEVEEINVGALRSSLAEVAGYLLASEDLAAIRDLMVDERDRSIVNRQLKLVAQQIQEPLWLGRESAESVAAMTKRPGMAGDASKIAEFMGETRAHFAACAGGAGR